MVRERQGQRQARRLRAAAELAAAVAAAGDVAQLYQQAAERAAALFDAEWATVRVYDPAEDVLVLRAMAGPAPYMPAERLAPGTGIAGHAFAAGKPVLTNAYAQLIHGQPQVAGRPGHAAMAVPLCAAGRRAGTLSVRTCRPVTYDADDLAVLDLFGRIVAAAVERVEAQAQA
ncbi:MAG: GAF domain-containing protein, partial [Chloroflexi bacterium]|nr:GAF domain-containing protein [Chloroflexota bacterium]